MSEIVKENLDESKKAESPQVALHSMRKSIDAIIQWSNELRQNRVSGCGREMLIVYTKLQEARMWTGKCLERFGSELPEEFRDEAK